MKMVKKLVRGLGSKDEHLEGKKILKVETICSVEKSEEPKTYFLDVSILWLSEPVALNS